MFSGGIDLSQLPERLNYPGASNDRPNGTEQVPSGVFCWVVGCQSHRLVDETKDLTVQYIRKEFPLDERKT